MQTADEIIARVKQLPVDERRRVAEALRDMDSAEATAEHTRKREAKGPYSRSLELAGTMHSDFMDLSTDKNKHMAAVIAEQHARR